jgi:hypothetical protein
MSTQYQSILVEIIQLSVEAQKLEKKLTDINSKRMGLEARYADDSSNIKRATAVRYEDKSYIAILDYFDESKKISVPKLKIYPVQNSLNNIVDMFPVPSSS